MTPKFMFVPNGSGEMVPVTGLFYDDEQNLNNIQFNDGELVGEVQVHPDQGHLLQYTDHTDKEDAKLWSGDRVRSGDLCEGTIVQELGCWIVGWDDLNDEWDYLHEVLEVITRIGNIHTENKQ